jgi:RND family efflux transporter MFP subunit
MKHVNTYFLLAGLLWTALSFAKSQNGMIEFSAEQQKKLGIQTTAVKAVSSYPLPPLPAEITAAPQNEYHLSLPFAAKVEALPVLPGALVKEGDVLLRLQSPEILDLQARLKSAEAHLQEAQKRHARVSRLVAAGVLAQKEDEMAMTDVQSTRAAVQNLAQTLRFVDATEGQIVLRAPASGTLLFIHARRGETVAAQAPLVTLAVLANPWLDIMVPVTLLPLVQPGLKVQAQGQDGIVKSVGGINPRTEVASVKAELHSGAPMLQPGLQLSALLFVPGDHLFTIPKSSVTEQQGHTFVFIAKENGFLAVVVERMGEMGDNIVVRGPLAGQKVVSQGTAMIKAAWGES